MPPLTLLAILIFAVPAPAIANERLGGGFGSLIFMALGIAFLLFLILGLASICEFINKITGRPNDHPFGSQLLMFGGLGSVFSGFSYLLLWGSKETAGEDFLISSFISFFAIYWLFFRGK